MTSRRNVSDIIAEMRKHKPGHPIPTYHNICGGRTTYLPCQCSFCTEERNR